MTKIKALIEILSVDEAKGDVEVVWTDRDYKTHKKIFKNDPQGSPENANKKARNFMVLLEL